MPQAKIRDADINSAAAIDRTKLAAGTARAVVVNDASGVLSGVSPGASANVLASDGTSWTSNKLGLVIPSGTAAPSGGSDGDLYLQYT